MLLHTFTGPPADGIYPKPNLTREAGDIYGTTQEGGVWQVCQGAAARCSKYRRIATAKHHFAPSHLVAAQVFVVQTFEPFAEFFAANTIGVVGTLLGVFQDLVFDKNRAIHT
jgi:hypothetical protein